MQDTKEIARIFASSRKKNLKKEPEKKPKNVMTISEYAKTKRKEFIDRKNIETAKTLVRKMRKGKSIKTAAKEMDISLHTAYNKLRSPAFHSAMDKALEIEGLSDRRLAKTFKETLEANRPVVIDKEIQDYPDHPTRLKAAEVVARLKGHYEGLQDEGNRAASNISININFVQPDANTITINPEEGNNNE